MSCGRSQTLPWFFMWYGHYIKNQTKVWDLPQDVSDEIFFSKIGMEWGTYFSKKVPNFQIVWPTPAMPRALTVKGVYVVSHSCYEQLYEPVCINQVPTNIYIVSPSLSPDNSFSLPHFAKKCFRTIQTLGYFHNIIRSRIPEVYIFENKKCQFWPFFFWPFDCYILILSNTGGIHLDLIVITVGLLRVPFCCSTRARSAHKPKYN